MSFVQFTKVSLAYGPRDLLKEVGLNLASGSRAALAGANGSGKSTLMKVIAGAIAPDSGERAVQKGTRVVYLPQSGIVHRGRTLREEVETAFDEVPGLIVRMEELARELERATEDNEKTRALLEEHHSIQESIEASGWYDRSMRIAQVTGGLGFSPDDLDRATDEFSGGWQMRIALAKVLLSSPNILLLDEPTNYLDIEARSWLELWLLDFKGGYLVVSHDRYFLDVTVNEVYELFQGSLKRYAGNYSAYEKVRKVELESLLARYEAQREEIAKTEDFIRRFRYQASKAAMVQDRVKRLEKIEPIEIPETLKKIHFSFPPPPHSGRLALTLEGVGKRYGDRQVLKGLDLVIEAGEKLVVVGRNGAGKTTLLRILSGADSAYEGAVSLGTGISIGYFSQDVAETMTGSQSVLEALESDAPMDLIPKLRDLAGAFLFRGDDVYKSVSVLSGGEKSRLALLKLLFHPVNLLILDEPTNHLDLHSKDVLLDALRGYPGTVVFVSHDRLFMEALATKTLELSPAGHRLFYGDYGYYLDRLQRDAADAKGADRSDAGPGGATPSPAPEGSGAAGASSAAGYREEEKKRQALRRRLEREEADLLAKIEAAEAEKAALEAEISRPEVYSDGARSTAVQKKLDDAVRRIDEAAAEWERVAAELEKLKQT
jgi:ATP-binding cassette subfamily F protein 3